LIDVVVVVDVCICIILLLSLVACRKIIGGRRAVLPRLDLYLFVRASEDPFSLEGGHLVPVEEENTS
jgi:hypothetical protein